MKHLLTTKVTKSTKKEKIFRKDLALKNVFLVGLVTLVVQSFLACHAQTVTGTASLAAPLDNLQGSARDMALGSAFVGVADDASALFFNPAGLAGLKNPDVALNHNSYLAGTFQETLEGAFPGEDIGGLAFALDYVSWGSLDLRDNTGVSQGSYNDTDIGLTAGWGKEWAKGFSTGLSVRGLQQKVVNDLYNSLAADVGLLWRPQKELRFGVAYLNLGTPVMGSSLSGELKGGASLHLDLDPHLVLLTALSGSWIPNGASSGQGGLECVLDRQWALRVGGQVPFYDNQVGGFTNFTAGAGLRIGAFSLDYAYLPFGTLGTSHRISLGYEFSLPKEVVKVPVQVPVTVVQPVPQPTANPQDVEVHFKIPNDPLAQGQEFEKEGKKSEAARTYVEALKGDPQNAQLWSALGNVYYQMGQKDYAIRCFKQSLKLKPNPALENWLKKYRNSSH